MLTAAPGGWVWQLPVTDADVRLGARTVSPPARGKKTRTGTQAWLCPTAVFHATPNMASRPFSPRSLSTSPSSRVGKRWCKD